MSCPTLASSSLSFPFLSLSSFRLPLSDGGEIEKEVGKLFSFQNLICESCWFSELARYFTLQWKATRQTDFPQPNFPMVSLYKARWAHNFLTHTAFLSISYPRWQKPESRSSWGASTLPDLSRPKQCRFIIVYVMLRIPFLGFLELQSQKAYLKSVSKRACPHKPKKKTNKISWSSRGSLRKFLSPAWNGV